MTVTGALTTSTFFRHNMFAGMLCVECQVDSVFKYSSHLCVGVYVWSLFCYAFLSSFEIVLTRKRELSGCFTLIVFLVLFLCLFLTVPWVGLQYVIVVFPDLTNLLFSICLGL